MASYAGFGYVGCELTTQLTANEVEKCEISEATSSGVVDIAHSPMATFINEKSLSPVDSSSIRSADPVSLKMGENSKTLNANSINLTVAGHYKSTNLRNAPEVSCCENGHILTSDSVPGQRVCSCQYDSARLPFGGYTRVSASSVSVYGTPYASADQSPFSTIGVESTSFYSPLNNHYTIKDSPSAPDMTAWTSAALQPASSYYSYDPTFTAYGYGASYDLAARRKNATRESTATLKAWLNEHKKNPYPTKGEKIMLAIITKMTLTQVSTWFANARRRLKKENKMTWEPKNKSDDDDDAIISEDDKNKEIERNAKIESHLSNANIGEQLQKDNFNVKPESSFEKNTDFHEAQKNSENINLFRGMDASASCYEYGTFQHPQHSFACYQNGKYCFTREPEYAEIKNTEYIIPVPTTKPKIWSVADTVACKTPPPSTLISQQKANQGPQASVLQELNAESQQLHLSTASTLSHSPSSMPASYLNAPPYSRVSLGYESTFNGGIYNTELANNSPRSPPSLSNQLLYSFQSHPYVPQQHRIGFSEIQPDTPPQTPPNIKVLNGNNSSSQHQININQSGLGYTLTTDHNKTSSLSSSPCLPSGRITRFDEQQQPQIKLS